MGLLRTHYLFCPFLILQIVWVLARFKGSELLHIVQELSFYLVQDAEWIFSIVKLNAGSVEVSIVNVDNFFMKFTEIQLDRDLLYLLFFVQLVLVLAGQTMIFVHYG